MADLDIGQTTITNLTGRVEDFSVSSQTLDSSTMVAGEYWWDYPKSAEYLGYYKSIPELKKAIDALAIWTVGKGATTDTKTQVALEQLRGWGEDSFLSIMENMIVQKKVLGDAYAEIIREGNTLINLKPLYAGDMRVVVNAEGIITRYEQRTRHKNGKNKVLQPEQVLHLVNDRFANEIHGVSVIEAVKWVIDARNEAMRDLRLMVHRMKAMGILEIDTENTSKRNTIKTQVEDMIRKGEILVLPKGTAEIKDANLTNIKIGETIQWIQYLENFFYQAVGIPKVIASAEGFSEASSKVGYLTFEPIYTREQTALEEDLRAQLGIKVKFNRPPSLTGVLQESESKNTGQLGVQPNDVTASATRTE